MSRPPFDEGGALAAAMLAAEALTGAPPRVAWHAALPPAGQLDEGWWAAHLQHMYARWHAAQAPGAAGGMTIALTVAVGVPPTPATVLMEVPGAVDVAALASQPPSVGRWTVVGGSPAPGGDDLPPTFWVDGIPF